MDEVEWRGTQWKEDGGKLTGGKFFSGFLGSGLVIEISYEIFGFRAFHFFNPTPLNDNSTHHDEKFQRRCRLRPLLSLILRPMLMMIDRTLLLAKKLI